MPARFNGQRPEILFLLLPLTLKNGPKPAKATESHISAAAEMKCAYMDIKAAIQWSQCGAMSGFGNENIQTMHLVFQMSQSDAITML